MDNELRKYKVVAKKKESTDSFTLDLSLESGAIPDFVPGQYINIFFKDLNTPEGKAYSISSAPYENQFSITVKVIGKFSSKLDSLEVGGSLDATLPYGYFYSEEEDTDLVLIAGGIGVTPFRSIILDNLNKKTNRHLQLIHSIKKDEDAVFVDQFQNIKDDRFDLQYFITRQSKSSITGAYLGRIDLEKLNKLGKIDFGKTELENPNKTEYMICGSISFVRDIWKNLKEAGVSEYNIYTEAFFS